jgi:two-component system sensor kinase FixL
MIDLLVRGKGLINDLVDFAVARYARQRHPSRLAHRDAYAFASSARSTRAHGRRRLGTSGSDCLVLHGDLADMPRKRIALNERETGGRKSGWRRYTDACLAWLYADGRNRRRMLDQNIPLKSALELLPIPILTVHQHNRISFANAKAIELFGYAREELIGASLEMLFPVHGLGRRGSTTEDGAAQHGICDAAPTQMLMARRRDGEGFHVEANTTTYGACDQPLQIIAIAGRSACLEVDRNRNELAHLARVSSLGELASSLAHELNQPLTAILSNAQAAQKFMDSANANSAELREALADIILDNCRASEVIQKIRTMVRKGDMEFRPVEIGSLVRNVALLVHSDAMAREVRTRFDIAEHPPMVFGDNVQLQQVVLNLLLNAFDAVKECDPADRMIETTVREEVGGGIRITVKDRGHGLTVDKMNKIFRPFFTTKPQGLGLGLSISRTIVTAHGGQLWAENNEDKGASFHIALPPGADLQRHHPQAQ